MAQNSLYVIVHIPKEPGALVILLSPSELFRAVWLSQGSAPVEAELDLLDGQHHSTALILL